jgi:6-phosphogluconate dehydrogenase
MKMKIGLIGLDAPGIALASRFMSKGYEVIAYDETESKREEAASHNLHVLPTLESFIECIPTKRIIFLAMNSRNEIDALLNEIQFYLSVSDILIDTKPADEEDLLRRSTAMLMLQIDYLDCGLLYDNDELRMVFGGNRFAFQYCEYIARDLTSPEGYLYGGRVGAGHFAALVHSYQVSSLDELNLRLHHHWENRYNFDAIRVANFVQRIPPHRSLSLSGK